MAQVRQTVADALQWVKAELDQSVSRVRQDIETYLEAQDDALPLQRAVVELHQIRGTLTMVRCPGAAFLADEMKNAVQDILRDRSKVQEAAFESLLGASLQLSDYIDLLSTGVIDCALVFQPQINELRIARGKGVYSESALFAQHLTAEPPMVALPDLRQRQPGQAQAIALKLLPPYQVSLLQWIKDQDIDLNLKRLGKIAEHIAGTTRNNEVYQLWWLYAAVVEALLSKGIEPALEIKRLFGQAGQQLKHLAEQGEDGGMHVPTEISYTLLYLVGRSTVMGPRTQSVRIAYALEELLPPAAELDQTRARLRGPNTHLMQRLSEALKQDISSVKDAIDLVVRAGDKLPIQLDDTIVIVDRIADTLAMLGLHMLQRVVMNQTKLIEQLRDAGSHDEKSWMEVAVSLLRVEHSLDDALFRQIQQQGTEQVAEEDTRTEVEPRADLHGGEAAIWREALVNIARVKTQIKDYIDNGDSALMTDASRQLNEVAAGFEIQGYTSAAEQTREIRDYLASAGVEKIRTDGKLSNQLADAIANLEYYLESLQQRHPHAKALEQNIIDCVEQLRAYIAASKPAATEMRTPGEASAAGTAQSAARPQAKALSDVDPEIRAVFLEEASEVLGQLQDDLQRWLKDIDSMEILRDIRRAFHTLKGSGRMVGATLIGDFGWAHENMLNKCLEGAIGVSNPVVESVKDAVTLLPDLITNLQDGGGEAIAERAQVLIERAGAASRGELGTEAELHQVFRQDAQAKLSELDAFLQRSGPNFTPMRVDNNLIRAFHTLKGSGEAVGAIKLAQLAAEVEYFLESVRNADRSLQTDELKLMQSVLMAMRDLLAWMTGAAPLEPDLKQVFIRLRQFQQAMPATSTEAASDYELVIIFTDEASDLLDRVQESLKAWRQSPSDHHHSRTIKGLLHTLKGSARTVQALAIGELSEALEGKVDSFIEGNETPSPDLMARLDETVEGLYTLLDRFRQGERAVDAAPLLAALEAPLDVASVSAPQVRESAPAPTTPAFAVEPPVQEPMDAQPETPSDELAVAAISPPVIVPPAIAPSNIAPSNIEVVEMPAVHEPEEVIEMPAPPEEPADLDIDWAAELAPPMQVTEPLVIQPPAAPPPDAIAASDAGAGAPTTMDPELLEIFAGEAQELIEGMDSHLALWERDSGAAGPRREMLRSLHTLKGSARMAGIAPIGDLSHELESQIAAIDQGRRKADVTFFSGLRNAVDAMHGMLDRINRGDTQFDASVILADLRGGATAPATATPTTAAPTPVIAAAPVVPSAPVISTPPVMATPVVPEITKVPAAPTVQPITPPAVTPPAREPIRYDLPPPQILVPPDREQEMVPENLGLPEQAPMLPVAIPRAPVDTGPWASQLFWQPEQADASIRAQQFETARVQVGQLDSMLNEAGEISIYRSRLEQQNTSFQFQLNELVQTISRIRDQVRKLDFETQAQIQSVKEGARQNDAEGRYEEFDPLEMDRYSRLQEMSRALAESMTDLESLHGYMDELRSQNEMLLLQQARVNSELHQRLMRSLMVPFARQVQRLERIVRQTAQEDGKQARVEFSGVESELDRKVLERMVPPLEHLLRNAIVHGLETPAERRAAGKPEVGLVSVQLSRDGPQLVIDVSDDGRGLNLSAIHRKAVDMGLAAAHAEFTESDIIQFIFEPGFSTAKEVTQAAGRGVGMDIVNAEIKQLGGNIETRTTAGAGTHFVIRLPLSLTITQALLVHVAEELYALPMNTIEGIARINRSDLTDYCRENGPEFNYGGHNYHVKQMSELLHLRAMATTEGEKSVPLLLVRAGDRRAALAIDEVLGTREVVVKAVGLQVSSVAGVTGATILADGRVVVILDAPALVQTRLRRALTTEVKRAAVAVAEDERPLVMVVDDSITMRRVAERTLVRNGFRVSTAKDGMDALGKLQIEFPQLVLLDIEMPRIDGFELATYMRNSEKLRDVPIIMITSRSGEKHRARAEQIGVNRYMIKPYQEDELIRSIHELLAKD